LTAQTYELRSGPGQLP